jgi:hypothetical protein
VYVKVSISGVVDARRKGARLTALLTDRWGCGSTIRPEGMKVRPPPFSKKKASHCAVRGQPQPIILRGKNRPVIFVTDEAIAIQPNCGEQYE